MIEVIAGGAFKVVGGDEPPDSWFWRESVAVMAPKAGLYSVEWDEKQVSVTRVVEADPDDN